MRALYTLSSSEIEKPRQVYFQLQRTEDVDCSHLFTISPLNTATLQSSEDTLPSIDLKAYARRGAEARVAELIAELNDIYKAFPDLRRGRSSPSATTDSAGGRRRTRKPMSAAQRKAVGQRMKAYWAARKAKKAR